MGSLRPSEAVGVITRDGVVYAATLPSGPIVVLDGVAAVIWSEACAGNRESIAERVAAATDVSVDEIRGDVDEFVDDLVARGLLRERGNSAGAARLARGDRGKGASPARTEK